MVACFEIRIYPWKPWTPVAFGSKGEPAALDGRDGVLIGGRDSAARQDVIELVNFVIRGVVMRPAFVGWQAINNVLKPREAKQRREAFARHVVIQVADHNPASIGWIIPKALPNNLGDPLTLQAAAVHGFFSVTGDALEVINVNRQCAAIREKDIHFEAIPSKNRLTGAVSTLIPLV